MGTKYIIDVNEFDENEESAKAIIYQQVDDNEPENEKNSKYRGIPYSFWVSDKETIDEWKRYFDVTGIKRGEFITSAINEYIKNNPITQEQKIAYNNKIMSMFEEL